MHFDLVDRVLEQSGERIVTIKLVSGAEEYLKDHFPTFPVLPGVFMLEAMVQAARKLTVEGELPMVLGQVRALKYGSFVRPGMAMRVDVAKHKALQGGAVEFKGEVGLLDPAKGEGGDIPTACSGRFVLRPARIAE